MFICALAYFTEFNAFFQLNMQTTGATTEKSRYLRELQDLKDHLYRANASSDRDGALKEKVFNDAKAEVINLNKKVRFVLWLKLCEILTV